MKHFKLHAAFAAAVIAASPAIVRATTATALAVMPANAQHVLGLIPKTSTSISISISRLKPEAAAATCKPGSSTYNRFSSCGLANGTFKFIVNNKQVGKISFQVDQTDLLAAKSTTITEKVDIHNIVPTGQTLPTELALTATCGTGCKGGSHAPVALIKGATYKFSLHFVNTIAKNEVRSNTPTYTWEFSVEGVNIVPSTTHGLAWRCDDKLRPQKAGCVHASFVPTITSLAGLKFIAANIRTVQARGGPAELHRNSFLADSNRKAVCNIKLPPGWKPPKGWPLPLSSPDNKPYCDEYPFAATWEGGKRLPAAKRGTAWVPAGENNRQGGLLGAFYLANRVLDASNAKSKGDAFYVFA